ncbi:MAG TPA: 3-deoxy-8-phosphooctulonate synthase, partial [Gammaproteobacteria bacterium]|nr:3-deoxy-8-phosphooctulonate synthase [Gammaproteobacteria bacterium]
MSLSNKSNLVLISGLNVLEDKFIVEEVVGELKKVSDELDIPFIFKASYDKANRSSIESFRGPGIENGLEVLRKIKSDYKVPVMSDVHSPEEVKKAKEILDVIQIPAFLCRQTDLISSAAITGLPINVKRVNFFHLPPQVPVENGSHQKLL